MYNQAVIGWVEEEQARHIGGALRNPLPRVIFLFYNGWDGFWGF